jgi:hypothetical protein
VTISLTGGVHLEDFDVLAPDGPKQIWIVPGAYHTAAMGYQPDEVRRMLGFYDSVR